MRKPEDGDIKPTKKAMKEAYDILANIVELIGDDDENTAELKNDMDCLLYTSPSPRDWTISRMPSSA